MIVFADLHLREETERTVFEQVLPGILEAAKVDPDQRIAFLGDWWHVRYRVPIRLQNRVAEWLRECQRSGVRLIMLPGNHDQVDVAGENALEVFSDLDHVQVYSQPTWDRFGFWVPYRKRHEDISQALAMPEPDSVANKWRVLWMHHGVRGADMNDRFEDTQGLPRGWFSHWLVFCGHYHKRQTVGTVTYVGSPYQTRADESGQDKGYAIWNPETQVMQYMDCHWGKRYHRFRVEPGQSLDLSQVGQGDEVRVTAAPGVDLGVLTKALDAVSGSVVVMPEVEVPQARLQVGPGASLGEYAYEYAKRHTLECNDGKSLERLMQVYQELTQG